MNSLIPLRISLNAEKKLLELEEDFRQRVLEKVREKGIVFLSSGDLEEIIEEVQLEDKEKHLKDVEVIVNREGFRPIAKEYDADFRIDRRKEVTGKSKTRGRVEDFVKYFQNRFKRISHLFPLNQNSEYSEISLSELEKFDNMKVRVIVMITEKRESKSGNIVLEVEDLEGRARAVITKERLEANDKLGKIIPDDIVAVYATVRRGLLLVEDIEFPGERSVTMPKVEKEISIAYISDVHVGSRFFMEDAFLKFIKWLKGETKEKELAGTVKYILIAGDLVDGIGIYPGQEKELEIKDIFKQYEYLSKLLEEIPDYIEVFLIPGNHDAVRRAEPTPALKKDLISADVHLMGNPSYVYIENILHLVYHGTSLDSIIASVPGCSYEEPRFAMFELLRRRHLSPIFGTNPIAPEWIDYLVIDPIPNVVHMGHLHKNDLGNYRGALVVNSGTFQDQTPYQLKQGHIPSPGEVYIFKPSGFEKGKKVKMVRFV